MPSWSGCATIPQEHSDETAFSLFRRDNADPLEAAFSALMDPRDMPQTVSHYAWLDGVVWENDGWTLTLSDRGIIRINPVIGVFTRQWPHGTNSEHRSESPMK